ncbi:MAG TPA: saccharopine dehydrogenase C-terminal domain-containing protein [Thermoplasmata archaeon]|nr:saccharopine dehydrogenase C-terminal domain-containing protein [Thermoplasmata archaeon]
MGYRYSVIGSGRQGTAAAYDFARFGDADDIVMADMDLARAKRSAARVNKLADRAVARPLKADVTKPVTVLKAIRGADVILSGVPYFFNLGLAKLALRAKVSMVDLGGNTDLVREQLALNAHARKAGVGMVPDCGMGPGLNITMGVYATELLDVPEHVYIYDGGLPQHPRPPWNYELTFNVEGLTNEYYGDATFIRDGRVARVPLFSEFELVDFPPLGRLEAIVTPGGLSTAPWSFQGKLKTFQNKTLRYPGHWAQMQAFRDLGLFELDPVEVDGRPVVPRHVFHALFEPKVTPSEIRDVCVERVRALGMKDDHTAEAVVELVDYYDEATGFTSMERLTGWHAAIAAEMLARGVIPPGTHSVELGVPAKSFVEEARKRGLHITERVHSV